MTEVMVFATIIVLGLCAGSFVNALVWRLHEQETRRKKLTKARKRELSILHGRSMCVHCGHTLAWYELLPVISWISLGGKCRYCHRPISWQYPLAEAITAGLFVVSYIYWPYNFFVFGIMMFVVWLLFVTAFMALAVYDLRWMILPDKIVYPLIGLMVVHLLLRMADYTIDYGSELAGALLGFIVVFGLFYMLFRVSDGKWIGYGDVKLAIVIGPLVGSAIFGLLIIFIASILGTLASLPYLANKTLKPNSQIPFGPFLIIATMVVYLFGKHIIAWYVQGII